MREAAVMYSGGTDSTAAVVLTAERFERVHLVTYKHSGLAFVENSGRNIPALRAAFPKTEFLHRIMDTDRLFKLVTYSSYLRNLREYGLLNLGTCGFCKLAMHLRTLVYCAENGLTEVIDGSNKNMTHFPAQMEPVLEELRGMYQRFGITFTQPVYHLDFPEGLDWLTKLGVHSLAGAPATSEPAPKTLTTGRVAYEKGILPQENVKGTALDRKMQARCFQLTLLNAFALGWYIPRHGYEKYTDLTVKFYQEKIRAFSDQAQRYLNGERGSRFAGAITHAVDPKN